MTNYNSLIKKYDNYELDNDVHEDSDNIPGAQNIIGILKNETIEDVFRVFGGTIKDTPHSLWNKVSDGVYEYVQSNNVIQLDKQRTIQ